MAIAISPDHKTGFGLAGVKKEGGRFDPFPISDPVTKFGARYDTDPHPSRDWELQTAISLLDLLITNELTIYELKIMRERLIKDGST